MKRQKRAAPKTEALIDRLYEDDRGGDTHLLLHWQTVEMNDHARRLERHRDELRDALVAITLENCTSKTDLGVMIAKIRNIARSAVPDYVKRGARAKSLQ